MSCGGQGEEGLCAFSLCPDWALAGYTAAPYYQSAVNPGAVLPLSASPGLSAVSLADAFFSSVLEYLQAQLYFMASEVEPCGASVGTHVTPTSLGTSSLQGWREDKTEKSFLQPGYCPFYPPVQLEPGVKLLPCCFPLRRSHNSSPPPKISWASRQ